MTQAQTIKAIRDLGLRVRVREGEFRITVASGDPEREEAIAYYTTDRDDAIGTAKLMVRA